MIVTVGEIGINTGTAQIRWGTHMNIRYRGHAVATLHLHNSNGRRLECGLSVEECRVLSHTLAQAALDAPKA